MEIRGRVDMGKGRTGGNGKDREMGGGGGGGGGGQHSAIVQFESLVQQFISASDIHRIHIGGHETVASHFCKIKSTAHSYH